MAIKSYKKATGALLSAIPGVSLSNSLVFSKLLYTTSVSVSQENIVSSNLDSGYYYVYLNKNLNKNQMTVSVKDSGSNNLSTLTFSSSVDEKVMYLSTSSTNVSLSQTIAFSSIVTGLTTNINSIVYGNGLFVIGHGSGTTGGIRTSTDLITWTARTSGIAGAIRAVSGDVFLAGSDSVNAMAVSLDAITWTSIAAPSSSTARLYFKNNFYVAFQGALPTIFYSQVPTGTWTSQPTTRTANNLISFEYGNNLYVAGDTAGFVVKSTNLITWTSSARATDTRINEIVYANNEFFIFATGINGHRRTTDFVTYTTVAINFSTTSGVASAFYDDGIFIATSTNALGLVAASTNGITWTEIPDIGGAKNDVFIHDNTAIVVGTAGQASQIELQNSAELQIYKI